MGLFHPGSSVRQTSRVPEFPDDRPGGQAVTHSGLQGFSHFVFVTNRRWWWHYCSPWQLWALNDTVEMERAKETRRCLRLLYCHCILYPGFKKSVYSWWWQSQPSLLPLCRRFTTRFSCWDLWKQRLHTLAAQFLLGLWVGNPSFLSEGGSVV